MEMSMDAGSERADDDCALTEERDDPTSRSALRGAGEEDPTSLFELRGAERMMGAREPVRSDSVPKTPSGLAGPHPASRASPMHVIHIVRMSGGVWSLHPLTVKEAKSFNGSGPVPRV